MPGAYRVEDLDQVTCERLLRSVLFGRIASTHRGLPKIVPVHCTVRGGEIVLGAIAAHRSVRILPGDGDPAQIQFHLDQIGVAFLQQLFERHHAVDGHELEVMIVIRELHACVLARFSGLVECGGDAFPHIRLFPHLFVDPGIDEESVPNRVARF